jgi:hypothetical protein
MASLDTKYRKSDTGRMPGANQRIRSEVVRVFMARTNIEQLKEGQGPSGRSFIGVKWNGNGADDD